MRRARWLAVSTVVSVAIGCGAKTRAPVAVRPAPVPRPIGALLLAHPGPAAALPVAGAPDIIVRGRVRLRVDAGGAATRASDVTHAPARAAVAVPAWLGGGVALLTDDGLVIADRSGKPPATTKGAFVSVAIGARELWLRARSVVGAPSEWIRLDPTTGAATVVAPPIAAPIAESFTAVFGGSPPRPGTAGPEFATREQGLALVDLLGPIRTRDGGLTWSPFDPDAIRSVFGATGPARILRDGATLLLANDERAVPVLPSGQLGDPVPVAGGTSAAPVVPDTAAVRAEIVTTHGVPRGAREILVTDGPRLAIVSLATGSLGAGPLEPLRVTRATRLADVVRCELHPSADALAVAACARSDANAAGHLAIGVIEDDASSGPSLSVEKTFAFGTGHRATSTGAVAVSATCAGPAEGGLDLLSTTKACVRDARGAWRDLAIPSTISGRRAVLPTASGAVLVLREDPKLGAELVAVDADGTIARATLGPKPRPELVAIDEVSPGRFVAWRRSPSELRATTIEVDAKSVRVVEDRTAAILKEQAIVGASGERALIAELVIGEPANPARVEASVTTDRGKTWSTEAWPDDAPALDLGSAGRQIECGAIGCRAFGWSRIGWQPEVAVRDEVVDASKAQEAVAAPSSAPGFARLHATCSTLGAPRAVARADVPSPTLVAASGVTKDAITTTSFGFQQSGTVRGGLVVTGPKVAPWGESATAIVRWSSDLDPIETVHESAPFAWLFPGRGASVKAIALAPSRVLLSACIPGRCEVLRVVPGGVPEPIDLGATTLTHVDSARELSGVLALVAHGPVRAPNGFLEPSTWIALLGPDGKRSAYLGHGRERSLGTAVDAAHGTFALVTTSELPIFGGGTTYALPIGPDARPSGAFEALDGASSAISRPTTACTTTDGWQIAELPRTGFGVEVALDGAKTVSIEGGWSAVIRHRLGGPAPCLDRVTYVGSKAAFQLDPQTSRAVLHAVDEDGKAATRRELSCTLAWK